MDTTHRWRQDRADLHRLIEDLPDLQTLRQLVDALHPDELPEVWVALHTLRGLAAPMPDEARTRVQDRAAVHRLLDDFPDAEILHQLVDKVRLPALKVRFALLSLGQLTDPVQRALSTAPADDEPMTAEDEQAIDEAHEVLRRHEAPDVKTLEEVRRELGL